MNFDLESIFLSYDFCFAYIEGEGSFVLEGKARCDPVKLKATQEGYTVSVLVPSRSIVGLALAPWDGKLIRSEYVARQFAADCAKVL